MVHIRQVCRIAVSPHLCAIIQSIDMLRWRMAVINLIPKCAQRHYYKEVFKFQKICARQHTSINSYQ